MAKRSRKNKKKKSKYKKVKKVFKKKRTKTSNKKNSKKQFVTKDSDGNLVIKVSDSWSNQALVNKSKYQSKYNLSVKDNDKFWKKEGKRITWIKPYTKIKDVKYSKSDVHIKWYYDGTLNASANCIDRHLARNKNKTAIIWVGDNPSDSKKNNLQRTS